jgi:hypothetical protein
MIHSGAAGDAEDRDSALALAVDINTKRKVTDKTTTYEKTLRNQETKTMGFDIYGLNPKSETGRYFRKSIGSGWHQLAEFIIDTCPKEITGKCEYWHRNDGSGLNESDSIALADILNGHLRNGLVEASEIACDELKEDQVTPDFVTNLDPFVASLLFWSGPSSSLTKDVAKFSAFLRNSGGFEIW